MVNIGSDTSRDVDDYQLSRFACYLIAQNGDPKTPEIASAQKYFANQTRRQELSDQMAADLERLEMRRQTSEEFKALSGAARQAGVQSRMFGIFHDAGYKGLYGGLGVEAIKARKRISAKEQLMDRMDTTELAANQFRMTTKGIRFAFRGRLCSQINGNSTVPTPCRTTKISPMTNAVNHTSTQGRSVLHFTWHGHPARGRKTRARCPCHVKYGYPA